MEEEERSEKAISDKFNEAKIVELKKLVGSSFKYYEPESKENDEN